MGAFATFVRRFATVFRGAAFRAVARLLTGVVFFATVLWTAGFRVTVFFGAASAVGCVVGVLCTVVALWTVTRLAAVLCGVVWIAFATTTFLCGVTFLATLAALGRRTAGLCVCDAAFLACSPLVLGCLAATWWSSGFGFLGLAAPLGVLRLL